MIKFMFKGRDGSCGYRKDKVYRLTVHYYNDGRVRIVPLNPFHMVVPYDSEDKFFENWSVV